MNVRQKLQIVAEMLGRPLSVPAAGLMTKALEAYPEELVHRALDRVARECRQVTLAEITSRLPGAAPGPDEAWAIASKAAEEDTTVVWTDEIAGAHRAVAHMTDRVAARMAFRDVYQRLVAESSGLPRWWISAGHDPQQRAAVIQEAVEAGRLPASTLARWYLPVPAEAPRLTASGEPVSAAEYGRELLAQLRGGES